MKILLYNPDNGVTRNFMPHLWMFLLQSLTPEGHEVVLIDGNAVKACTILAAQAEGSKVTTIEGLATDGALHPMQAAFKECHGLQCGFCTPGMVMSAIDLVQRHPNADEKTIRAELEGNLCRCTGYQNIVKAVAQAAAAMRR